MSKIDHVRSARAYLEQVSNILTDVPTPSINAAVMRGAGVRFSAPAEGIPGPRRIILDGLTTWRPLATGTTAAALLARQRGNLAYLDARWGQLAEDEAHSAKSLTHRDLDGWIDHAYEVMDILRAVPLLGGSDFTNVFGELADLAGIEQHGPEWEVRTAGGEWTGTPLDALSRAFSLESLKAQTEANAARLRRWRNSLRVVDDEDGSRSSGISTKSSTALPTVAPQQQADPQPAADMHSHAARKASVRHHQRALAADKLAEYRRRFPELYSGITFTSAASPASLGERRRRFPELFVERTRLDDHQAGEDGLEMI